MSTVVDRWLRRDVGVDSLHKVTGWWEVRGIDGLSEGGDFESDIADRADTTPSYAVDALISLVTGDLTDSEMTNRAHLSEIAWRAALARSNHGWCSLRPDRPCLVSGRFHIHAAGTETLEIGLWMAIVPWVLPGVWGFPVPRGHCVEVAWYRSCLGNRQMMRRVALYPRLGGAEKQTKILRVRVWINLELFFQEAMRHSWKDSY